jgi:hypothetical protein
MKTRPQPALTTRLDVWSKDVVLTITRASYVAEVKRYGVKTVEIDDVKDALGMCDYIVGVKNPIVIGWFDGEIATLVHECVHAAMAVLDDKGVPISRENDEALAYTIDYLFATLRKVKRKPVIRTRRAS